MKQCLGYWSRLTGAGKYTVLVCMVWSLLWRGAGTLMLLCIYSMNELSLSMFSDERKKGGRTLTLTLPFSRKTLWDTRMWGVTMVYLLYGVLFCMRNADRFDIMFIVNNLLFGHAVCGVCLRKREWYLLSGLPGFVISFLLFSCIWWNSLEGILNRLQKNPFFLAAFGVGNLGLLALDFYIWSRERRLFIGGMEENEKNVGLSENA